MCPFTGSVDNPILAPYGRIFILMSKQQNFILGVTQINDWEFTVVVLCKIKSRGCNLYKTVCMGLRLVDVTAGDFGTLTCGPSGLRPNISVSLCQRPQSQPIPAGEHDRMQSICPHSSKMEVVFFFIYF